MIRHVVVFTWQLEATDEQKQQVSTELAALPGLIPELRGYAFGDDIALAEGNGDFAVVADFDDIAGYLAYRDNADHVKIVTNVVRPITAHRAAVQLEI